MATGRTISATFLTEKDKQIFDLCNEISIAITKVIQEEQGGEIAAEFKKEYSKISYTRDGGLGLGGGKIQRDALCTRGKQGKAPFSNRNLRWHPLIVSERPIDYATPITAIRIDGDEDSDSQTLVFITDSQEFPSEKVYEMPKRYVAFPEHWLPHIDRLKHWNDNLWTQNSCVIPAYEACDWQDAVETYAVLGVIVAAVKYSANFASLRDAATALLNAQSIDENIELPSSNFPTDQSAFLLCPLCKSELFKPPANQPERSRETVWKPGWQKSKREEGDDSSIQIMHVEPLIEAHMNHNAKNVRYGHRWCNLAMTDHSLDETLDFMEFIVRAHNRGRQRR